MAELTIPQIEEILQERLAFMESDPTAMIAVRFLQVKPLCSTALSAIRERDALRAALKAAPHGPFCTYLRSSHQEPCDCRKSRIGENL